MLDHHHPLFCLIPRTSENTEGAIKKKTKDLRALRVILHLTAQERSVYTSVSKMDFIACLCDIWQSETCLLDWKSWGTQLGIACSAASKAPQKLSHNIISHPKKIKAMCVSSWLCVYVFLCVFVFVCVCVCACVRTTARINSHWILATCVRKMCLRVYLCSQWPRSRTHSEKHLLILISGSLAVTPSTWPSSWAVRIHSLFLKLSPQLLLKQKVACTVVAFPMNRISKKSQASQVRKCCVCKVLGDMFDVVEVYLKTDEGLR